MNTHPLKPCILKESLKIEICTILIAKGNSYYCRKSTPSSYKGPQFKVSSEGLATEIYRLIRSTIQVLIEVDIAEPKCTRQLTVAVCHSGLFRNITWILDAYVEACTCNAISDCDVMKHF